MGYTINWRRAVELPADRFAAAVVDCEEVLSLLKVPLAGFEGVGPCIFEPDHIVINGQSPFSCEPFEVACVEFDRRGMGWTWSFCKTQLLPYDLCVKVALIILAHHLGELLAVGSDGTEEDWEEARRRVKEHKGYGADFRRTIA